MKYSLEKRNRRAIFFIAILLIITMTLPLTTTAYAEDISGSAITTSEAAIVENEPAKLESTGASAGEDLLKSSGSKDVGDALKNCIISLKPTGLLRELNVNNDAAAQGNRVHLFNQGASSKNLLIWNKKSGRKQPAYIERFVWGYAGGA